MDWLIIAPIASSVSIAFAFYLYRYVNRHDAGSPKMKEIADAIKIGANAYLKRQNMALALFVGVMAIILGVAFANYHLAIAYILGSLCTTAAAYFGMNAAVRANVRTANSARKGLDKALPVAYFGGAVMGLSIVGMAVLGTSILYYVYTHIYPDPEIELNMVVIGLIICGSIAGALVGVELASMLPAHVLRRVFAIFLIIVAVRMFMTSEKSRRVGLDNNMIEQKTVSSLEHGETNNKPEI